jgi:putative PIN family toxin of toxin-antitoxin system
MSASRPPSAVVDTNLLVSALITPRGTAHRVLEAWRRRLFRLIVSALLYQELAEVLRRPKLAQRYGLTTEEITVILNLIARWARVVRPVDRLPIAVRDPKDEMVLATALGGRADYLVTGDQDLLVLDGAAARWPLRIVTAREFLERLGS